MKKSKLLIPSIALASAGAIAMPIVLTSCGATFNIDAIKDTSLTNTWISISPLDISTKNTYNFNLKNSSSLIGKVTTLTVYAGSKKTSIASVKSVTINGKSCSEMSTSEISIFMIPEGISGDLQITVKFASNLSEQSLVAFVFM